MKKIYYAYCVKPNKFIQISKNDIIEMMKEKKANIMKKYGIDKLELMRCYKFFNFKKWGFSMKTKKEITNTFWHNYENAKYIENTKEFIKELEDNNNVQEFLQLIQ